MNYIFAKLNTKIGGHQRGQTVRIVVDGGGVALSIFWRKRVKDSKLDDCLTVLKDVLEEGFVNA